MGIQEAVGSCFSKYMTFEGRASRAEYWWWALFVLAVAVILVIAGNIVMGTDSGAGAVLAGLFILVTILPGLAVSIRRLHDTDHSGGWFFIQMVPAIGALWFLYLMVISGTQGANRFGDGL